MNSRLRSDNTSGYKGVSWHNETKKWQAKIWVNSKGKNLGYFKNKMDAVKKYNQTATRLYKEFARINII